jgi:hypothetical protein
MVGRRRLRSKVRQCISGAALHQLTFSPIITADWTAPSGQQWTVPLGGGIGRVFKIGDQPVNAQLAFYDNIVHPDGAADWQLRFQFALLFPTK